MDPSSEKDLVSCFCETHGMPCVLDARMRKELSVIEARGLRFILIIKSIVSQAKQSLSYLS